VKGEQLQKFFALQRSAIVKSEKARRKTAIAESRSSHPAIYVRLAGRDSWRNQMAKASIRVKAGEYQYLTWRDGNQVRTFYLGRKKRILTNTCSSSSSSRPGAAAPDIGSRRRTKR
jgi:hypothetical protein